MSDLLFEDKGTTDSVGSWSGDSNFDITVDGTGTLLRCKSGKTWVTRTPSPTSSFDVGYDTDLGSDIGFGVSLNIMDISNAYIRFTNVGGDKRIKLDKTGKHVVTITPTGIYLDGMLQENTTPTSNISQVSIQLQNTNDYIKYHDFQIYKIAEKRYHYADTLHRIKFYDKEDITGNQSKPGLLKDKSSIRINVNQIDDFPSTMNPNAHTHGNINNTGIIPGDANKNKNVVTNAEGKITTENKPSIPQPNTLASVMKANGTPDAGTNNNYARADHIHPQDPTLNNKSNTDHGHGNIDSEGVLKINGVVQRELNVMTNSDGKIIASRQSSIPIANDTAANIKMNGLNANAGSSDEYARADHIHPRDSELNNKANLVHSHGLIDNAGVISGQKNKNVVTNSQGAITTEDKPSIPQANTVASNIIENGVASAGLLTTFAKADHIHPSDSKKANLNHSHGLIDSNGVISNQKNKNVVTNNDGKITTEDKVDYSDDIARIDTAISNINNSISEFAWIDARRHRDYSGTSVHTNSNILTCLVNEKLGLCYIRVTYPGTVKKKWTSTGIKLPTSLSPIWTTYLQCEHLNQMMIVVDDGDKTDARKIKYYNNSDFEVEAAGFFFISGRNVGIYQ